MVIPIISPPEEVVHPLEHPQQAPKLHAVALGLVDRDEHRRSPESTGVPARVRSEGAVLGVQGSNAARPAIIGRNVSRSVSDIGNTDNYSYQPDIMLGIAYGSKMVE